MRTDDLVAMLATGAGAVEPNAGARRFAVAIGWGALGATLLMGILLGVRGDLAMAVRLPMFWVKVAYVAFLAPACLLAAFRLSQPGLPLSLVSSALVAPVLAMWLVAASELMRADPPPRTQLFFG